MYNGRSPMLMSLPSLQAPQLRRLHRAYLSVSPSPHDSTGVTSPYVAANRFVLAMNLKSAVTPFGLDSKYASDLPLRPRGANVARRWIAWAGHTMRKCMTVSSAPPHAAQMGDHTLRMRCVVSSERRRDVRSRGLAGWMPARGGRGRLRRWGRRRSSGSGVASGRGA